MRKAWEGETYCMQESQVVLCHPGMQIGRWQGWGVIRPGGQWELIMSGLTYYVSQLGLPQVEN